MREGNSIIGGACRAASICLAAFFGFSTILACAATAAQQTGPPAPPVVAEATAPKIHELLTLLADPGVQAWLKQQNETKSGVASRQDIGRSRFRKSSTPVSQRSASTSLLSPARSLICRTSFGEATPELPQTSVKMGELRPCCFSLFFSVWARVPNGCFAGQRRRSAATSTRSLRRPLKTACIWSPCALPLRSV